MHVAISGDVQKLIEQRMKSGKYATPEDVVAAGLYVLDQNEKTVEFADGELDQLLAEGEDGGDTLDGKQVLVELRELRGKRQDSAR